MPFPHDAKQNTTRRAFLGGCGTAAWAGAAMQGAHAEAAPSLPPLPWLYRPLDPELVRKKGHKLAATWHCCAGVCGAIVSTLAEKHGAPFDAFPWGVMQYGAGGVAGFGSLCGALNGAGAAISLVCYPDPAKELLTELINWHAATPLPTETSNRYAVEGAYLEGDPYTFKEALPQAAPESNLCHVSVSNWCKAAHLPSGSPERSERCRRLTGDVAAKTVALLNAYLKEDFAPKQALPGVAASCVECHDKGPESYTRGKMDCRGCHIEPIMSPHDGEYTESS